MVHQVAEALYEGVSAIFVAKNEMERQSMVQKGSRALDNAVYDLEEEGKLDLFGKHFIQFLSQISHVIRHNRRYF